MKHTLTMYHKLLGVQLRSQMQYRVSFWLDLTGTAVITLFEFAALALVFERFGDLGGWTLGQVAFLYGIVNFAFAFSNIIFSGFNPSQFGQEVRMGTFDRIMLRPVNITAQVLGSRLEIRRMGKIFLNMGILAFAFSQTNVQWTILKLIYAPIVLFSNVLFFGGLYIIGSTITFWTIESIEVMNTLTYGGSFATSHPMHIYPNWIIRFFTFIVPAIFLTYFPAIYILDLPNPLGYPEISYFLSPVAGLGLLLVGRAFWHFGIKHYQSTGS
jgi:ABC-2 type transport system permease protein